jgi:hypothetical protein
MRVSLVSRRILQGLRLVLLCLITVPATVLFVMFLLTAQKGSFSGSLLSASRSLVSGAPPGKVWDCTVLQADVLQPAVSAEDKLQRPVMPSDISQECEWQLVDEAEWQQNNDHAMKTMYWCLVGIAAAIKFGLWWLMPGAGEIREFMQRHYRRIREGMKS